MKDNNSQVKQLCYIYSMLNIMNSEIKITLVQYDIVWENVNENLKLLSSKLLSETIETDLIILPEMFTTGFTNNISCVNNQDQVSTIEFMKKVVEKHKCAIVGSILYMEDNKYYNRLIFIDKNDNFTSYDKNHLFSLTGEDKVITQGINKIIIQVNDWKIMPIICYDVRFPTWLQNNCTNAHVMEYDYDCLICVANWPSIRKNHWTSLLTARALDNQCYVVGVNRIGTDGNNRTYTGNSSVINPLGEILFTTSDDTVYTLKLKKNIINEWRSSFPILLDQS